MLSPSDKQALIDAFKKDVCERGVLVDPYEEMDWLSLTVGYLLAKGVEPADAVVLAAEIRYVVGYGVKHGT